MVTVTAPSIPNGWRASGHLPPFDVKYAEETHLMSWFTEDLLQVRDPLGLYLIDIGWYPERSPDGTYRCRLVKGQDWGSPLLDSRVTTLADVRMWLDESIALVKRKIAQ